MLTLIPTSVLTAENFVRFLLFLAGILSTVFGSWVASKIHAAYSDEDDW
jgi:hypothetical protein